MTDDDLIRLRNTADYILITPNTTYEPANLTEFARLAGLAADEALKLRAEINRIAPFLALHGVEGYG